MAATESSKDKEIDGLSMWRMPSINADFTFVVPAHAKVSQDAQQIPETIVTGRLDTPSAMVYFLVWLKIIDDKGVTGRLPWRLETSIINAFPQSMLLSALDGFLLEDYCTLILDLHVFP